MGWFTRKKKQKKQEEGIRIRLSGDEHIDIQHSFQQMGITDQEEQEQILKNYTWHYLDDLDEDLKCTMQLVQTAALEAAKPFLDSRDLLEEKTGVPYLRKSANTASLLEEAMELKEIDVSTIRVRSLLDCKNAGFKPAQSLPTIKAIELRPVQEIAGRLHAIKALVLWVMVSAEDLPDAVIFDFIAQNKLNAHLTKEEKEVFNVPRQNEEARAAIGWKFENTWPLAWYFGYEEPDSAGEMMTGERMQDILVHHTCPLDEVLDNWLDKQTIASEEQVLIQEDLFYCLHNAVRSAQLGEDTVPSHFDPIGNGGTIHERRHALTWMLSNGISWEQTDLST